MSDWESLEESDILVQLPSNFQELRESKRFSSIDVKNLMKAAGLSSYISSIDTNKQLEKKIQNISEYSDVDPNWQPNSPGSFAEHVTSAEVISTGRPKIHIMVDNIIRDLGSVQYHTKKLIGYIEENRDAEKEYEHYVKEVCLGGMVVELVDFYRRSGEVSVVTDPVLISAAEETLSLDLRVKRIVGADSPSRETVVFDADPVEEGMEDPGIERVVLSLLRKVFPSETPKIETPKSVPVRKRIPIPSAELAQIQARLCNINI